MKSSILFIAILFLCQSVFSQQLFEREKRDNVWLLGASPLNGGSYDAIRTDFTNEDQLYEGIDIDMNFHLSNSSICDPNGNLLLYTNGTELRNVNNDTLTTNLAPTQLSQDWLNLGYPLIQGALLLSLPNSDSIYYLFHGERDWNPDGIGSAWAQNLFITIINITANQGAGLVLKRDSSIISDTLALGRIVATRHANGRDWWIIIPELDNNFYYSILFTPEGVEQINNFQIGESIETGFAQSSFSPDGTMYARNDLKYVGEDIPHPITVYNFDRCSGVLTSPISFNFLDLGFISGGLAFSENSRFLYAMAWLGIYQYDLWADDIPASKIKVLEYDTLGPPSSSTFGQAQLAPDGKIYVSTTGSNEYLSVIHKPNLKGLACKAEVRAIELPVKNFESIPNLAYYGLGPLDGSPCDTLNINNPTPQVTFDYVIIDSTAFSVDFYDGSIFSPEEWYWEFGDGFSSTDRFPSHTYAEYGSYEVCLTASNETGSNMVCQEVSLGVTGTGYETKGIEYRVWPNPASEILHISAAIPFSGSSLTLYSMDRRSALSQPLLDGGKTASVSIERLNTGVYILEVKDDEGHIWREKVIVQ